MLPLRFGAAGQVERIEDEEQTASPLPPQIILFVENVWDFAEGDGNVFRDEIRTTFLHELGHYLGLDEDDLIDRAYLS